MEQFTPPPSSIEEAAALLGASITRLDNNQAYRTNTPPVGLHSSFSTVQPVPCSELFFRLASLHKLLKAYADDGERDDTSNNNNNGNGNGNDKPKILESAPSIIPLLHKLFAISSSLALTPVFLHSSANSIPSPSPFATMSMTMDTNSNSNTTNNNNNANSTPNNPQTNSKAQTLQPQQQPQQRAPQVPPLRITPPLTSQPLRHLFVQCLTLAHRLSPISTQASSTTSYATRLLEPYLHYITSHPRSSKSCGGTRIAALALLTSFFQDFIIRKNIFANGVDSTFPFGIVASCITICHNGLKSSGANDVLHRLYCVRCANSILKSWRICMEEKRSTLMANRRNNEHSSRMTLPINLTYCCLYPMDLKLLTECVRLCKKAADDKYTEVRKAAADLASVLSSIAIEEESYKGGGGSNTNKGNSSSSTTTNIGGGNDTSEINVWNTLDEIMLICLKNLDDENPAVSLSWSQGLAKCISTAIEYHAYLRFKKQMDESNRRKEVDESTTDSTSSKATTTSTLSTTDLAMRLKAFSEGRRVVGWFNSACCITLESALQALVHLFIKVGGENTAAKMGGSFSVGGKQSRIGLSYAMSFLCQLQNHTGGIGIPSSSTTSMMMSECISATDVLKIILGMVGSAMEHQLDASDSLSSSSSTPTQGISPSPSHDMDYIIDATSSPKRKSIEKSNSTSIFTSSTRNKSQSDACLARLAVNHVIRHGISSISSEPVQLNLLRDLAIFCNFNSTDTTTTNSDSNRHNVQVCLIEISHLVSTLGEAAASSLDELIPALKNCLSDQDHGVRYEAAIALQAVISVFPSTGRKFIMVAVDEIQQHRDEILSLSVKSIAPVSENESKVPVVESSSSKDEVKPRRRFRRQARAKNATVAISPKEISRQRSLDHQYIIHGYSLALAKILHLLPSLSGGLPSELLEIIYAVAESLIDCQGNEKLGDNNPGALCTCVRAGYCLLSAILTMGPSTASQHMTRIFDLWTKSVSFARNGMKNLEMIHEISCIEPMLTNIVIFLKDNSECLLSIPDALRRISEILETLFTVISAYEQRSKDDGKALVSSRLDSTKAAIMEAFSWLPPGSFPLIADNVFSFAAMIIKSSTENDVVCSLLPILVSKEDDLLNIHASTRTYSPGQSGGRINIENYLSEVTSEPTFPSEREAVVHFLRQNHQTSIDIIGKKSTTKLPTVLHSVGTWNEPPKPSTSAQVRVVDAAIHVFAATFGLQDGHQQAKAVAMLEDLFFASVAQSSRSLAIISDKLSRQEFVSSTNIAAALLSCLQALPLHEGSNGTIVGMGPPWMSRATKLFGMLLPSSITLVRRVAAEGLGLLAALGVTEDAHTLQSSILHSLDDYMQGNLPDVFAVQKMQYDAVSAMKAGSIHTLGCLQRTARNMAKDTARARSRFLGLNNTDTNFGSSTPTMIMLTRILPHSSTPTADDDSLLARCHTLHAFKLLLSYSEILDGSANPQERNQIIFKAVEVIENNFFGAWKSNASDIDNRSREIEKFGSEPTFLAALVSLMRFLIPHLYLIKQDDPSVACRFISMVSVIIGESDDNSSVMLECLNFVNTLCEHKTLFRDATKSFVSFGDLIDLTFDLIQKNFPQDAYESPISRGNLSYKNMIVAVRCLNRFMKSTIGLEPSIKDRKVNLVSSLFGLVDYSCSTKKYLFAPSYRNISVPRCEENTLSFKSEIETEALSCIESFLNLDIYESHKYNDGLLNWILFPKSLTSGEHGMLEQNYSDESNSAVLDVNSAASQYVSRILDFITSPVRWQIKYEALKLASISLKAIHRIGKSDGNTNCQTDRNFDLSAARSFLSKAPVDDEIKPITTPSSFVVLHLDDLITLGCSTTIATLDQAELSSLQNIGLQFIIMLIDYFAGVIDPDESSSVKSSHLLDLYVSQLIPSIKHALSSDTNLEADDTIIDGKFELFFSGCQALLMIAKTNLVPDGASLKRIVKHILPSDEDFHFTSYPSKGLQNERKLFLKPTSYVGNRTLSHLPVMSKLWVLSDILLSSKLGSMPSSFWECLIDDIHPYLPSIAVNCAAFAIDGFRLSTIPILENKNTDDSCSECPKISWLTFSNYEDVNDCVRSIMSEKWPVLATSALVLSLDLISSEDISDEQKDVLKTWVDKLVTVTLSGLHDSIVSLKHDFMCRDQIHRCAVLLLSVNEVISSKVKSTLHEDLVSPESLVVIIQCLFQHLFFPTLRISDSVENNAELMKDPIDGEEKQIENKCLILEDYHNKVFTQGCLLLENICMHEPISEEDRRILVKLMSIPLVGVEEGSWMFDANQNEEVLTKILSSFLLSMKYFIDGDYVEKIISQGLVSFILKHSKSLPSLQSVLHDLLRTCLNKSDLSSRDLLAYTKTAAEAGDWETWDILCCIQDLNVVMEQSLVYIGSSLENFDNVTLQESTLIALCNLCQKHSELIPMVMNRVGVQLMHILKYYGTYQYADKTIDVNRSILCANTVKIIMFTLQNMISQSSDNEMQIAAFLGVVFEILASIIAYNGLPNQDKSITNKGSDPNLGRMCAQLFVHVLRLSPNSFKLSMSYLSVEDRSIVESAVRADMSGYTTQRSADNPLKKKLNLKSFSSA